MSTAALPLPADGNPIQSDATLQTLLRKLDKVKKYKTFQRWKGKFLDRLTEFLYQSGMDPATKRCDHFKQLLATFVAQAEKVTRFIEKDELGENRKTVKAALALQEMCKQLTTLVEFMRVLIPSRKSEEKQCGFSKFHLGASLIRQGFQQYTTMMAMDDALKEITDRVGSVADRQQLELFDMYRLQIQRFCDVMADLHLYEVMIKCVEFAEAPEVEESSDEEDIHIEITVLDGMTKKQIKLEVDPNEKIGNIKQAISNDCGIAPTKQVIKFRGKELSDDNATLKREGVDNNAKLTVEPFTVPIKVKTFDGKEIDLRIDPSLVYMSDLKRMLEKESGIPGLNQQLSMGGKELDNDFLLASDYDIVENSVLNLRPKAFGVTVKMPDGTEHPLDITVSDTTESIKEKIQSKTGMPISKQVLKHQQKLLPSGTTAAEFGVQAGSVLNIEIFQVPVTVNFWDGRSIQIMVDPTLHIRVLKRNLEEESGVVAENQRLFDSEKNELVEDMTTAGEYGVKEGSVLFLEPKSFSVSVQMPDGNCLEMTISSNDTADMIKQAIEKQTGMVVPKQILKFNGTELPKGKRACDAGVENGSRLTVDLFTVPIVVHTFDGNIINIFADPYATIGTMKKQLEPQSLIEVSNQRLSTKEDGTELRDDNVNASDFGIVAGTELYLEPKSISVVAHLPDGSTKSIVLVPSDKVTDIKEKISIETGIIPPSQVLKWQGHTISDSDTARGLGITDGSKIHVELFEVPIVVHTIDGKVINVAANPYDTLRALKNKLEPESGIAPNNQLLRPKGSNEIFSDDGAVVGDLGIVAGSELYLEPKTMMVVVELPNGSTTKIPVSPSDTVLDIKTKIANEAGMAVPRQVLKHNDDVLEIDGDTARQLGLRENSKLRVDVFTVPVVVHTIGGQKIKVSVDPTASLGDFKLQLEPDSGIPAQNQALKFLDGDILSNDGKSMSSFGVVEGSELYLSPKAMEINVVTPNGDRHSLSISPMETNDEIKSKIEKKTGISIPRQVLKFSGKQLADGISAHDLGLKEGSEVNVEIKTIPIVVRTMDGAEIHLAVEPSESLLSVKEKLQPEACMLPSNQRLSIKGVELIGDKKSVYDHGIKPGSVVDLEPKSITVSVVMPDGSMHSISIAPSDTSTSIKKKIEEKTGLGSSRQVLRYGENIVPANGRTVRDLGITEGSEFSVDLFKVQVTVKTFDGKTFDLNVEPSSSILALKEKVQAETALEPKKQCLTLGQNELTDNQRTLDACGVKGGSILFLDIHADPIIFVDIKCGTLFAMDRDEVIAKTVLNPHQGNRLDFAETSKGSESRDKIKKAMMESPRLGFATQVVVEKNIVEDYELEEAEKVKNMWGVNLKKREKNKKGEELIFVDPKTGACGELSRKKFLDMHFITPIDTGKGESLAEAETDTMKYDNYIAALRGVFGVSVAK